MGASWEGDRDEESLHGRAGRAGCAWCFLCHVFVSLLSALLESLNKSEQSGHGQPQPRESSKPQCRKSSGDFPSANGEAGGEAPKGYTQDQLDAVKRFVHCPQGLCHWYPSAFHSILKISALNHME